jgi:Mrp family chromosome partitioning ATPase
MSALDQAFIKAYQPRGRAAAAPLTTGARPTVPLGEALALPQTIAPVAPSAAPPSVSSWEARSPQPASKPTEAAARTASIERLFTNLAKPAFRPLQSRLPPRRPAAANQSLGIPAAVCRVDPVHTADTAVVQDTILSAMQEIGLASCDPTARTADTAAAQDTADTTVAQYAADTAVAADTGCLRIDNPAEAASTWPPQPAEAAESTPSSMVPPPHLSPWQAEPLQPAVIEAPQPPPTIETPGRSWRPMLQVEHYLWPKICSQLHMVAVRQLEQTTDALAAAVGQGHKVLAVGGCRAGDGATTMLLCVARPLARRGLRTVLVDGTFSDPQLAARLGLLPQDGWEDVLAGRLPLEEVLIDSTEDQLVLLPVVKLQSGMDGLFEKKTAMAATLDTLAEHYDVVLVDAGPLGERLAACLPATGGGSRLDAALVVHNPRSAAAQELAEIERGLSAAGVLPVGVIQNFIRA